LRAGPGIESGATAPRPARIARGVGVEPAFGAGWLVCSGGILGKAQSAQLEVQGDAHD